MILNYSFTLSHLEILPKGSILPYRTWTEVSVSGDWPIEGRFLLAVGRVGHGHPLLAAFRLHGRDVEDEISILDTGTRFRRSLDHAVLTECVADSADLEVGLGYFDLAAHRALLTRVLAIRVGVAGFKENLVLFTFSEMEKTNCFNTLSKHTTAQ
jgi:hypothetical protein